MAKGRATQNKRRLIASWLNGTAHLPLWRGELGDGQVVLALNRRPSRRLGIRQATLILTTMGTWFEVNRSLSELMADADLNYEAQGGHDLIRQSSGLVGTKHAQGAHHAFNLDQIYLSTNSSRSDYWALVAEAAVHSVTISVPGRGARNELSIVLDTNTSRVRVALETMFNPTQVATLLEGCAAIRYVLKTLHPWGHQVLVQVPPYLPDTVDRSGWRAPMGVTSRAELLAQARAIVTPRIAQGEG